MSCCNRGCSPCYGTYVTTGKHSYECCDGACCWGSYEERNEAEELRAAQVQQAAARAIGEKVESLRREVEERLRVLAVTAALEKSKEDSVREQLRRIAQEQEEEPEKPREKKPKVVHIKAAQAKPAAARRVQKAVQ